MRLIKLTSIVAIMLGISGLLNTNIVYANENKSDSIKVGTTEEIGQTLKSISVNKTSFKFNVDATEEDLRKELVVTAKYKERTQKDKVVTDYQTDFNKFEGKEGRHTVTITYTQGGVSKTAKICVRLCDTTDTSKKEVTYLPYIKGYEDGTFRPMGNITREELATMVGRLLLKEQTPKETHHFTDLSETRYSTPYIAYVAALDIMKGYEDGTFKPEAVVSKLEMNDVINKVTGWKDALGTESYSDSPVTRVETVILLNKAFERDCSIENIKNPYSDITSDYWAYKDIICASIKHTQ